MGKIPVGRTIEYAYGFTFGNFLTVLGLSWVSLAIMAVGAYFAVPGYIGALQIMMTTRDPSQMPSGFGYMFLFGIVAFACFNMIYVAIARQALGLRNGPAFFYFSLDSAFWGLLGAYLLTFLILFGVTMLVAVIAGVLGVVLGALAALVFFIGFLGIMYVSIRLIFLLAPIAVAEGTQIVSRSWSLARGNFWCIFAVLAAIIVPFMIVEFFIQVALFSTLTLVPPPPGAGPDEAAAFLAQLGAQVVGLLPVLAPIAAILYAAVIALVVSASAFAYRSLVPAAEGTAANFA